MSEVLLDEKQELLAAFKQLNGLLGRSPGTNVPVPWPTPQLLEFIDTCIAGKLWLLADRLLNELAARGSLTREQSRLAHRVRNFTATIFVQVPQIQMDSSIGRAIRRYVAEFRPRTILDIGAATGLGTTQVFADAVKDIPECAIYAMEAEPATFELLKNNTRTMRGVEPVLGALVTDLQVPAWPELREDIRRRSAVLDQFAEEEIHQWYVHGVEQLRMHREEGRAPWKGLPESLDLVMLDADLFFAREELAVVISRARLILLDDICSYKNTYNHEMLAGSPEWELIAHEPRDRHGWSAFKRRG